MDNHVPFEDRTQESPERAMQRELAVPAAALVGQAFSIAGGNPVVTIQMLAAALGQMMVRLGMNVDDAVHLVRPHHGTAQALMEEQLLRFSRHADA